MRSWRRFGACAANVDGRDDGLVEQCTSSVADSDGAVVKSSIRHVRTEVPLQLTLNQWTSDFRAAAKEIDTPAPAASSSPPHTHPHVIPRNTRSHNIRCLLLLVISGTESTSGTAFSKICSGGTPATTAEYGPHPPQFVGCKHARTALTGRECRLQPARHSRHLNDHFHPLPLST
jgi:hypothetical protein